MATGDDTKQEIKEINTETNVPKVGEDATVHAQVKRDVTPKKDAEKVVKKTNDFFMEGGQNVAERDSRLRISDLNVDWISKRLEVNAEESSVDDSGLSSVAVSLDSVAFNKRASYRSEKEKRTKLGHRRVRDDGQVTYKNILTSRIVSSIQLGIKHAIAQFSVSERDLLMQDFMTVESVPFSSSESPSHGYSRFVFKTYAPVAFGYFRDLFGIKPEDYLASFCQKPLKELSNSGNSGSIFYLTGDDRFIVKTTQSKECSFLQSLLPGYYLNLHQNPNTLLPKYFGLYCYKCDMKKVRLVAMNNILPTCIQICQTYDLKGATYKARATTDPKSLGNEDKEDGKPPPTYKDLDFLQHYPTGIYLNNETYNTLTKTIKRDCTVLESFKIMDYSLLLGITKIESVVSTPIEHKRRFSVRSSPEKHQEQLVYEEDNEHTDVAGDQQLNRFDSAQFSFSSDLKRHENPSRTVSHSSMPRPADDQSYLFDTRDPLSHGGIPAFDGEGKPILIYIGIIDILQSYQLKKKMEHAFKSLIHDGDTVSVHNPKYYSIRFQKFMFEKVFQRLTPTLKRKFTKSTTTQLNIHQKILQSPARETVV